MFDNVSSGFELFFTPSGLALTALGCFLGLVIGVLPGLGPLMGIILLTPVAFYLEPVVGMGLLIAIYVGGSCGGAISAILLRIPGTPLAAATLLDGYPMAQKGRAAEAVGLAISSSALGGLIGGVVLILLSPVLADFALNFGPFEYFALTLLGMISIAVVSRESTLKGLMAACLGLLLATVGADKFTQFNRFTFDSDFLLAGFHLVAIIVGLFAFSEVFREIESGGLNTSKKVGSVRVSFSSIRQVIKNPINLTRSSLIGTFFGALPGAGGVISSFTSYAVAKAHAKPGEHYGEGEAGGVIATESANNACCGGSLIPSLALAVPGDAVCAVLMGSLILLGFFPGPDLFEKNGDVVGGIFLAYIFANIVLIFIGIWLAPVFSSVVNLKKRYLIPIIVLLSTVGTYSLQSSMFDLWTMLLFGVVGYFLRKYDFPLAPVVIGLVLGPLCEENLRRSLIFSGGDYGVFFDRPISATVMLINVALLMLIFMPKKLKPLNFLSKMARRKT
ncbi:hypothetical protein GCM10011348_28730 [Marinobacterium nitratireducens]|uniref:DUF112 domain-containing protein n=1 Tax=Marinobacterium nitratireducens TaxID=518897 RepID=A0A918DVT7_9GAMM|nr:tripartite tricarboxylate transporter permease [Marinobacterium nitratireducens]GGO83850.1 hypothetical protein GCM10011348_28730 [Marinobacterium nitratireducens]